MPLYCFLGVRCEPGMAYLGSPLDADEVYQLMPRMHLNQGIFSNIQGRPYHPVPVGGSLCLNVDPQHHSLSFLQVRVSP